MDGVLTLERVKWMGMIGSAIIALSIAANMVVVAILSLVPPAGLVGVVGWILVFIAVKRILNMVKDEGEFDNVVMASCFWAAANLGPPAGISSYFVLKHLASIAETMLQASSKSLALQLMATVYIISLQLLMVFIGIVPLLLLANLFVVWVPGLESIQKELPPGVLTALLTNPESILPYTEALVGALIAAWLTLLPSSIFLKWGYERLATKTGVEEFKKVARLYYYGALSAIALVGFVLILIAMILQIKAFLSLPKPPTPQPAIEVQAV
jgi:uncharacterized membrane protein